MVSGRGRLPYRRVPAVLRVGFAAVIAGVTLLGCVRQGPPAPITDRGNLFFGRGTAIPVARPAVERPPANVRTRAVVQPVTKPGVITVQPGDTIYSLSRQNNVPIPAIINANNLTPPYYLPVGRQLVLPQQSYHRVAPGDTVSSIARVYGVSTQDLLRSNGIEPPYLIYVGQPILIPVSTADASQPASSKTMPPPPTFPAPSQSPTIGQAPPIAEPDPGPPDAMPPDTLASLPPLSAPAEAPIDAPPGAFIWPVQGRVLSGFGPKPGGLVNDGINIAAPLGTPVRASQDGTIAYAGNELRGYGNMLLVRHDNGWVTAYAHNSELQVARGDRVKRGQIIARVGSSGSVSEPQLHFEIRQGTRSVDPTRYLSGQGISG